MKKIPGLSQYILFLLLVIVFVLLRPAPMGHDKIVKKTAVHPRVVREVNLLLNYEVYAASIKSLSATLKIEQNAKTYDMTLEAETKGFIGKLFPWKTSTHTMGHVDEKGALIPVVHIDQSSWRTNTTLTETTYDSHGKALKMTAQDGDKPPVKITIDSTLANHATDVLTGMLVLLENAAATHKCTGKAPVFDGKRRFDITLAEDGVETLAPSDHSRFAGEAMRCILKVVPVAGFDPKDQKRGWMAIQNYTEARHQPPVLWLARMKNSGDVMPVRMEITSAYGSALAYLSGGTGVP